MGLMGWTLDAYQKTLGRRSEAVCQNQNQDRLKFADTNKGFDAV